MVAASELAFRRTPHIHHLATEHTESTEPPNPIPRCFFFFLVDEHSDELLNHEKTGWVGGSANSVISVANAVGLGDPPTTDLVRLAQDFPPKGLPLPRKPGFVL